MSQFIQFWLVSINANKDTVSIVLFGCGSSQPLVERRNELSGRLRWCKQAGTGKEAESPVWASTQCREYMRSPCQQMAAMFLLFINFGPSVDPGVSILADKFFVGVHVKWIFLLRIHTPSLFFYFSPKHDSLVWDPLCPLVLQQDLATYNHHSWTVATQTLLVVVVRMVVI